MNHFFNFEKLKVEVNRIRKLLIFYTVLPFLFFTLYFLNVIDVNLTLYLILNYFILLVFILFIWIKMPMDKYDKIGETFLILIFGWFALWMWIPNEKQLKEMISKFKEK